MELVFAGFHVLEAVRLVDRSVPRVPCCRPAAQPAGLRRSCLCREPGHHTPRRPTRLQPGLTVTPALRRSGANRSAVPSVRRPRSPSRDRSSRLDGHGDGFPKQGAAGPARHSWPVAAGRSPRIAAWIARRAARCSPAAPAPRCRALHTAQRREESPGAALVSWLGTASWRSRKGVEHGRLHDDSWSGLFRQIRAGNNDKTTVAGRVFYWQYASSVLWGCHKFRV